MGIEVEFTSNRKEVENYLEDAIQMALTKIGMMAERYAKLECPVDTGRLRNSISNSVVPQEQAVYIGTNVEYAPFVELGTSRRGATPYIRPACENHISEYREIVKRTLKNG